jgi:spore maturation protein CgeB
MLLEDTRPEARELFTEEEVGFFSDGKSLKKQLKYFLLGPGNEKREEMAFQAFCKISEEHSYVNRMLQIKKILEQNENH